MAGQLVRRGDTWLVRVYLGRDENGKRKYKNKTIRGNKKDAERELTRLLRQRDTGEVVGDARETVAEYLADWLDKYVAVGNKHRTYQDYSYTVRHYINPKLGHIKLGKLSVTHVEDFYRGLREKYAPSTCRRIHAVLRRALNRAVTTRLVNVNVAVLARDVLPKKKHTERRVLDPEEVKKFLTTAAGIDNGAVYSMMLHTGARPEEVLALKWDDVDFDSARININRVLVWHKGKPRLESPKTPKSRRSIPISGDAVAVLKRQKAHQAAAQLAAREGWEEKWKGLVFTSGIGTPLSQSSLRWRTFLPILREAELPSIRPYDLRHTHATALLSAREALKVVSERLGHASITLTADTYSHVLPDMQKETVAKLEKLWGD